MTPTNASIKVVIVMLVTMVVKVVKLVIITIVVIFVSRVAHIHLYTNWPRHTVKKAGSRYND